MTSHELPVKAAINSWRLVLERADKIFPNLTNDQLLREVAPGKNRLIYLWGHLIALRVFPRMSGCCSTGPYPRKIMPKTRPGTDWLSC
jgi:hypothetical protein